MEREKINIVSKKDLEFSYYIGPGKGGQKKQKTASGVIIFHRESGAQARNSESRSQELNKRKAFEKLLETPKFKLWLNKKLHEIREGEKLEDSIEKELTDPIKVKYEVKDKDGRWIEVNNDYFNTEEAKNIT